MNKEQEQGFFNQIEDVLHTHEETYELGAWEDFDANRKKSKRKWPLYMWTAAAVILLVASFALVEFTKTTELQNTSTFAKDKDQAPNLKKDMDVSAEEQEMDMLPSEPTERGLIARVFSRTPAASDVELPVQQHVAAMEKTTQQTENVVSAAAVVAMDKTTTVLKQDKFSPVAAGAYDSLMNNKATLTAADKSDKKLTYSLVVSPSLSNQKMNFGAGMELSYAVGKRVSISSGLMYTAINAKSKGQSFATANSTAQGANLAVSGIELPLGIQYQTNAGLYASAGVSAVGLINDKLEYSYLQENTVTRTEFNAGIATEVLQVVSERKTEKSIDPINNYMGFFNFSAGKKQAFGKVNLNIGPFVKVPFSSVSSEKINLLQGGLKISVDF